MLCGMFDRRLQQVLDDRGIPEEDPALRSHASVCRRCDRLMSAQQALFAGLELSRAEPPRRSFVPAVVSRGAAPCRRSSRQRTRAWVAFCSAAAVVAVLACGSFLSGPKSGPAVPASTGAGNATSVAAATSTSRPPRVWPLSAFTVPYAAELSQGQGSDEIQRAIEGWYQGLGREPKFQPVQDLKGGLRPITSTVNAALGTIWDIIPKSSPAEPGKSSSAGGLAEA